MNTPPEITKDNFLWDIIKVWKWNNKRVYILWTDRNSKPMWIEGPLQPRTL